MKCLFLFNPESGRGKIKRHAQTIVARLQAEFGDVDVHETVSAEDTVQTARQACGIYDVLVFSGGDGTFNDVVVGICDAPARPILGYIPSGTVNDIARNLGIPKNINQALDIITDGVTMKHDVGKINDHYFVYVAALGTFSDVSFRTRQKAKKFMGKLAYVIDGLSEVISPADLQVVVKTELETIAMKTPLILVVNSKSVGGVPFNRHGHLNDGYFDIIIVKSGVGHGLYNLMKTFLFGISKKRVSNYFTITKARHVKIIPDTDQSWCVDGEEGMAGTVEITNIPQHFEIFVPKKTRRK